MADRPFDLDGRPSALASECDPDNGGILVPPGFCALQVAAGHPGARHLTVTETGDVLLARENRGEGRPGGVTVLRDTSGDGRADVVDEWGVTGGNDVLAADGFVYQAADDAVLRYRLAPGSTRPAGPPDTLVEGLPYEGNHSAKSIAFGPNGDLFVSIGSASNACMEQSRTAGSPGLDPCPELESRAGIWRFDPSRRRQTQEDGERFATGLRNVMALRAHPESGELYGVVHGRDQLHQLWPDLYSAKANAEKPSEEFVRITEGADFGWPYCYHDPETGEKVLAPEYGGDGSTVGRCGDKAMPLLALPAHWAPNDLEFYTGNQFPTYFHGGAFIAFHGSWNRAPEPQQGYSVVFVAGDSDGPSTEWDVFADGFRNEGVFSREETARPVGAAVGPDGSLYVSDSVNGRIWRIVYAGR